MSNQTQAGRSQNGGNQSSQSAKADQRASSAQKAGGGHEKLHRLTRGVAEASQNATTHFVSEPAQDLMGLAKQYVKEKPDIAAMWCFAFGVIVGWKLRG